MPRRSCRFALILVPLLFAACDHAAPGRVASITDVGPFTASLPRRLTFSPGDDRTPSVTGSQIVYSREGDAYANRDYAPAGREQCLAFLPVEGGTVAPLLCPHNLVPPTDTFVNTWFEPALSPDGRRVAFTWQRGPNVGPLGFASTFLMVADVGRPADTTQVRLVVNYAEAGYYPRRADLAAKITWLDAGHLRFLATWEHIFKVKGGGAERVTDTAYVPLALMDADLSTGALTPVLGGDSVVGFAAAPAGGVWVVREARPDSLLLLDPVTGLRTPVGRFDGAVIDLATVDGAPVAIVDHARVERLDPATGALTLLVAGFAGPLDHLAAAGGRRFVLEAEQATQLFGAPSDLWLLEVPGP